MIKKRLTLPVHGQQVGQSEIRYYLGMCCIERTIIELTGRVNQKCNKWYKKSYTFLTIKHNVRKITQERS